MLLRRSSPFIAAFSLLMVLGVVLSVAPATFAQSSLRPAPANIAATTIGTEVTAELKLAESLVGAQGRQEVVVRLSAQPAGLAARGFQAAQRSTVTAQQNVVINRIRALDAGAVVLGRVNMALNAVIIEVDAAALPALARDSRVVAINPVVNYERALSDTVPYIGATPAVQDLAFRGKDVTVAVLDSGIDYTHAALGGPGTLEAYEAAYGTGPADPRNTTLDGLFPTERVVGGFDFVGEVWPNGPLAPDPDPIDFEGHGTHVADIIGGNLGVAPEVSLYAVKVCSAVSSSCSGVALLQAMDFVVDPNGDGDTSDHIKIVNMSLGAVYGQNYDDDLSAAVDNATSIGVFTVASAGNSADKPYVTGTPAAARTALSVAQTEVPSSRLQVMEITAPAAIAGNYGAVFQPWSVPLASVIEAPVQFGNGAGGNTRGCDPFPAGSLAGRIVLVDRGVCSFSIKIANIGAAGGLIGIIGLVAPGDPFTGGFGGGVQTIPGYMILESDSTMIKSQLAAGNPVIARFDPANQPSIVGTVVGSSSRGPAIGQMFYGNSAMFGQIIKPEIGAPGASISAVAGSGTGTEPFGGTSGAAPMVSGAAALLLNATNWQLSPLELKSRLMNTGETEIFNRAPLFGGGLAPITRIGGGEVRVDRAVAAQASAWEEVSRGGALSFGLVDATNATTTLRRTVVVRNYGDKAITYNIQPTFRFTDDITNGAVSVSAPASIRVPARSMRTFRVTLTIDGSKLNPWTLTSGAQGANGDVLTSMEYDGYLLLTDAGGNSANNLHMAWQVLPRLSGRVTGPSSVQLNTPATFTNNGVGPANINTYSLIGTSPNFASGGFGEQAPAIDLRAVGYATFSGAGDCPNNTYILQFAVNNWYRQSHANAPGQVRINLDTNGDGVFDFQVRNADFTLNQLSDGRNLAWVVNLRTGSAGAFFFTDHSMNSANMVLTICGSQLADPTRPAALGGPLAVPAIGQPINAQVDAFDIYFTGTVTDSIKDIVFAPGGERYIGTISDIPAGGSAALTVTATGSTTNTTETGVLLLTDSTRGVAKSGAPEGRSGAPEGREALIVTVTP